MGKELIMFTKYILVLTILLLLAACSGTSNDQTLTKATQDARGGRITPTSSTGDSTHAPMTLTLANSGEVVAVKQGDIFVVSLEGNVTTGFQWETDALDQTVLALAGEPKYEQGSSSNPPLLGTGGTFTFTFTAIKTGPTKLRLIYHRSFEKDTPPAQVFEVNVEIQ
jgi:inhibitor of cysteine peptidase